MLSKISSYFSSVVYIQIWADKLRVINVSNGQIFEDSPSIVIKTSDRGKKSISGVGKSASQHLKHDEELVKPFTHSRTIFSNFMVGEKLLAYAIQNVHKGQWLKPTPLMVIHPMEKLEGGLTTIEARALQEVAIGAGAKNVKLHVGEPLQPEAIEFKKIEHYDDGWSPIPKEKTKFTLITQGLMYAFSAAFILAVILSMIDKSTM